MSQDENVSVIDLDEMPSPAQIRAWTLQAAMTGKRKIVKVRGETVLDLG